MPEKRDLEDHEHIDDGLKMAFGEGSGSVLDAIESISGTRARILLRDAPDDASPMLRVAGPHDDNPATDDSRYQIVGEIARGGVGVVYKGRDKDLGRDVALKVLRTEFANEDTVVQRFIEEAQVGGQLQHPGIVPIYGMGLQADGRAFFAMKLIKGDTLTTLIEQGRKASELLGIFEQIAQTVAYAHSRGVLHRDLKPSNVMVGAFGEVQVVDWGFAKVLGREETVVQQPGQTMVATVRSGAEGSQSVAGSVMGTPAYMPPEQAMGQVDELTERSDVFSLGAILCEILTRKPPYTGTMQDQLLAAAQTRLDEAYARVSECNAPDPIKQLARDCMAPLPKDRPADAGVVAQRLADHLASVEERARQAELDAVQAAAESRRAERARRTTIALAAVALIALIGGGLGYTAWSSAERERTEIASAKVTPLLREATRLEGLKSWPEASATVTAALNLAETGGADEDTLAAARVLHARIELKAVEAKALTEKLAQERVLLSTLDELVMQEIDLSAAQLESGRLAAFREFHLDVDSETAAAALKDFGQPVALAVHLDDWARSRRIQRNASWKVLDRLARAIDDDLWRNRLRDARLTEDVDARLETLRTLAASTELGDQPPATQRWLALALDAAGAPEAALAVLHRARVRYPGEFWIHTSLGKFFRQRFRGSGEAILHAKAALALRPESPGAWQFLARCRLDEKDHDGAFRACRSAIRLDPGNANAHVGLGLALKGKGDLDGAIAAYREAIRLNPGYVHAHFGLGISLGSKRDIDGSVAAYREAIRLDPGFASAHFGLGFALYSKGDLDGAVAAYREAIRLDPGDAQAHNCLGGALGSKGDLDGAVAAYREAIQLDSGIADAHFGLGNELSRKGDSDGAVAAYREAIRLNPGYAKAHFGLGHELSRTGDVDGAVAAYREAIRLDPGYAEAQANLGLALQRKGDGDDAVAAFREAIRLNPGYAHAHFGLGLALQRKGDLDGAIAAYREAIRLDPGYAEAHYGLGTALGSKGDLDGAVAGLREAIRLNPGNARAHVDFGRTLGMQGDLDGAIAACREAIRLDQGYARAHRTLGTTLQFKGDIDGAIASYREAIRLDPGDVFAHQNLGGALGKKGDFRGSVEALQTAAALNPDSRRMQVSLAKAERLAAAHARVPAVLKGEDRPTTAQEWLDLAKVCQRTKNYASSARFWQEAFRLSPALANDLRTSNRYNAACTAALAGGEWHDKALAWLRADLDLRQLQRSSNAREVARAMQHWQRDTDLASVRDGDDLSDDWKQLWADVAALLKKVSQ